MDPHPTTVVVTTIAVGHTHLAIKAIMAITIAADMVATQATSAISEAQ